MERAEITKAIEVCKLIYEDAEKDIAELEGKPFTARTVAEFNGLQNAMIGALAKILLLLLQHLVVEGDPK